MQGERPTIIDADFEVISGPLPANGVRWQPNRRPKRTWWQRFRLAFVIVQGIALAIGIFTAATEGPGASTKPHSAQWPPAGP